MEREIIRVQASSRFPTYDTLTIADMTIDETLDAAYTWLCQRRKDWPPNANVWRFRRDWPWQKTRLREELLTGTYRTRSQGVNFLNSFDFV
jgi:hypothetical protein